MSPSSFKHRSVKDVRSDETQLVERGVKVAIRVRPLPKSRKRAWDIPPNSNSIIQTSDVGNNQHTVFTYDEVFDEDVPTEQVYDSTTKHVVDGVCEGINGTVLTYGEKDSGKTYTMQRDGGCKRMNKCDSVCLSPSSVKSVQTDGIIEMAARGIFSIIENTPDRAFSVQVSYMEIYNEDVRELLLDGEIVAYPILQVRADPNRVVHVNCKNREVKNQEDILEALAEGEKYRSYGSTKKDRGSSKSHSIFRIIVGSSRHPMLPNGGDTDLRRASLHFVDLAAPVHGNINQDKTKINQSLLTIGRVIVSLGQRDIAHINFRDSKLTRILQPSLSGNACLVIICCVSPCRKIVEETRFTLQFASHAKLVKVRPRINRMPDRPLSIQMTESINSSKEGNDSATHVSKTSGSNLGDGDEKYANKKNAHVAKATKETVNANLRQFNLSSSWPSNTEMQHRVVDDSVCDYIRLEENRLANNWQYSYRSFLPCHHVMECKKTEFLDELGGVKDNLVEHVIECKKTEFLDEVVADKENVVEHSSCSISNHSPISPSPEEMKQQICRDSPTIIPDLSLSNDCSYDLNTPAKEPTIHEKNILTDEKQPEEQKLQSQMSEMKKVNKSKETEVAHLKHIIHQKDDIINENYCEIYNLQSEISQVERSYEETERELRYRISDVVKARVAVEARVTSLINEVGRSTKFKETDYKVDRLTKFKETDYEVDISTKFKETHVPECNHNRLVELKGNDLQEGDIWSHLVTPHKASVVKKRNETFIHTKHSTMQDFQLQMAEIVNKFSCLEICDRWK